MAKISAKTNGRPSQGVLKNREERKGRYLQEAEIRSAVRGQMSDSYHFVTFGLARCSVLSSGSLRVDRVDQLLLLTNHPLTVGVSSTT